MKAIMIEDDVEQIAIDILKELGYKYIYGPDIAHDGKNPERKDYKEVVLVERLKEAIEKYNPDVPAEAREDAIKKIIRNENPKLIISNEKFHEMLRNGVDVEYRTKDGRIKGDKVWLFDFENPENNEFLAINQFTIVENNINRRPDVILFVNGLPLVLIELKNIADENATIRTAFNQIETYKDQISSIFRFNEICVISDGADARAGTITSNWERFMPWKSIDGKTKAKETMPQMEVLIRGMLNKNTLLDLVRNFITFEKDKKATSKKVAAYHQYYAVNKAVIQTERAVDIDGNKKCGVVWHTQGSGKSISMVFYVKKIISNSKLENPTIVVLTDRNDLDDQLFGTFSKSQSLIGHPKQAESREDIKKELRRASGGIIFTTIQKFLPEIKGDKYPLLSERRNIVVIADEAHRSQYEFVEGFAKHLRDALPNASFIGFTGTPIEQADKSTPAVFGNYIDIYDIKQSIEDGATVDITYESRLAKLSLPEKQWPKIDTSFEQITEKEESAQKQKLKSKWARMEAIVGSKKRVSLIAKDIVNHFEQRIKMLEGKGMIVAMSRKICIELYNEIVKIRPDWHSEDDNKGEIKVIITGSASDPKDWQQHIRNKKRRKEIGDKLKDPDNPLKLIIVRDMLLTGFDAPSLHTMYIDKPMQGHSLMQAIARVNRVYKDKPGGLIVDYLGIANELKKSIAEYTKSGGKGKPVIDQEEAVALMIEKFEIVENLFDKFDYERFFKSTLKDKLSIILEAEQHILKQKDGSKRYIRFVILLSKAFVLAVPHEDALKLSEKIAFFQAIKARLVKVTTIESKPSDETESAIRQLVSKSIASGKVIDIFSAAGLEKPDVSVLSEAFLMEVKDMPHKNLALEALYKLINDEIKIKFKRNLVKERVFSEMLVRTIKKYQNRTVEAAKIIGELIDIARDVRESHKKGKELGLTEDELAFYDALEVNDSAVKVLGDETLKDIAKELVEVVRRNTTIDWTIRENVKAKLRVMVKRVLKKYGYPPNKQKKATEIVLEQAKLISEGVIEKI